MTRLSDPSDPDRRPEGPEPEEVGALLASISGRRGWEARLRGARIHQHWDEIAGEQLARHVQPVRLAGGVLVVRAVSSAWATQVGFLAPELLARANAVLGVGEVTKVTVTTGRLTGS
ncbi:MAG: DUF721 domain-containing protein [Actinomycetota bacterium]|jgi:predicted nucleic acid-binding Zn ribbon protein|nr:DUF721 domain-containing protein [Actinomycetota bacterium]